MFERRILLFADLHIGSIKNIPYVYNTITNIFDKEIQLGKVDAVVFLGDYFHQLFKCNSEYVRLAINIMSYLMLLCRRKNIKVRMVYGTESHDSDQYGIFDFFTKCSDFDFKVITTAQAEDLFFNCRVLYLPEEYVYDKESYYSKLLSGRYDYIFGHGVIQEGMPMAKPSVTKEKSVPIFKSAELARISKVCVFGHYHIYTDMGNSVYYLGSLFRNSFGEDEAKGYGIIENDELTFVENSDTYEFKTYVYPKDSSIYKDQAAFTREFLRLKVKHKGIFDGTTPGKIRMVFHLPDHFDSAFKEKIKSVVLNENCIVAVFKDEFACKDMSIKETTTEYDYVLDDSLQVEDKIHNYINKHYDYNLPLESIGDYIRNIFRI